MKIQIMYVNSDLIYEEKTLFSTSEALPLLEELMQPSMAVRLLEGENRDLKQPKMPCAIINYEYTDGVATLNIFPEGNGFTASWAMEAPRWNFLQFIKKNYVTEVRDVSFNSIPGELNLLNVPTALEFMERSKSR